PRRREPPPRATDMNPTSTIIPLLLAEAEPWHAAPWAPHAVALFAFASGIALWLAGRSYLRLTFMFAGAGVGALSGFEAGVAFLPSFNPLLCAGIGLGLGALLGLVAFRFAVAVSLGAVAAVTSALVTLATISVQTAPA